MLSFALNYLSNGYSVIPLRPKSKVPMFPWIEHQKRKASESEIREWFLKWPDANIGIVTGPISQVAIVDLDGPEGIQTASNLGLSSTTISITGNGKHLWYSSKAVVSNAVRRYPGIDVRGDGGYIVAPPSIHLSGRRYRYLRGAAKAASMLPPFPAGIFAQSVSTDVKRNEPGWIAKALEEMTDGNIDNTLTSVLGRLRRDNWTAEEALTLLQPHAANAGALEGHLEDKIRNVWGRYEPKSIIAQSSNSLVLHSPANPDSLIEYDRRTTNVDTCQLSTGYPKFDTLTKGLKPGELLTVAARTGVGKTNWILGPIKSFCEAHKKVVLFSTEMSFDQIWGRYKAILNTPEHFQQQSFYICDEFTPHPERIEEALRQVTPDLFIFDHISHVGTEHHELSKFMMSLKELARRFNIPGIVTAQLNRSADWVENGERVSPRLSMIKGSGSIEEISAQVLLLSEKRVHGNYTELEGIVDKNRHGDKGIVSFGLFKEPHYHMKEL